MQQFSHAQGLLLAQFRPGVTTPVTAFTASALRTEITLITAAIDPAAVLTTVGQMDIAIYQDDDGTTYDQTTILFSETRLQLLQDSIVFQAQHPGSGIMLAAGGSIGVETTDANDVTFNIFGITETRAARIESR